MAKIYLEMGSIEKAKKHLYECLQIDPADTWSSIMLGNIYARNEGNLEVGAFYYEKCLEHHPEDPMVLCNYAAVMMDKGEYQKAEVLFKKTLDIQAVPNAYYGLALLYRMAGHLDAARDVLETYFTRFSHQKGADNSPIHDEAKKLYNEISAELRVQEKSH